MTTNPVAIPWESLFQEHQRFLWGLTYRLTGNAADAEDIVQETFVRAMKAPPARLDEPWRPWLVQVALNLGRDALRKRRRQAYDGPWLPSPIETNPDKADRLAHAAALPISLPSNEPLDAKGNPVARYDMLESVSFAFLLALEALTPAQRAVLLLRDVFDYSVRETATVLGITEPNVKTLHSRARRALRNYDQARIRPTNPVQTQTRQAIERFMYCLGNNDVAGVEALLAHEARALSDGGGEYHAARLPVLGANKIALFYSSLVRQRLLLSDVPPPQAEIRQFNGLPAILFTDANARAGYAPRSVMTFELNPHGKIIRLCTVLASRKLSALNGLRFIA